jgi:separase
VDFSFLSCFFLCAYFNYSYNCYFSFSGKCFGNGGQIHETHKVLSQSISVLVSGNPFGHTCSSVPLTSLLDYIGKEIAGDAFTVERAVILHNICWFSLKNYHSKDTRYLCNCRYFCV